MFNGITGLSGYSTGDIVLSLAFASLFALWGYRMSARHRALRGVTPWRLPSAVWAAICFVVPFGILLEVLAQATTKSAMGPSISPQANRSQRSFGAVGVQMDRRRAGNGAGEDNPRGAEIASSDLGPGDDIVNATARLADHDAASGAPASGGYPPPPADAGGHTALFGWYPDVTTRHHERYWDGRRWSEHVRDGSVFSTDEL